MPQNTASHLGLFCLLKGISSRNEIILNTPDGAKNESGLTQMMMGKSIYNKRVNVMIAFFFIIYIIPMVKFSMTHHAGLTLSHHKLCVVIMDPLLTYLKTADFAQSFQPTFQFNKFQMM